MRSADLGRRRMLAAVTDSRRHLVQACRYWYPIHCDLHRLFIAMTMAAVNDDGVGCTAPYPLVWSVGFLPKRRRFIEAVRDFCYLAWFWGPLGWRLV